METEFQTKTKAGADVTAVAKADGTIEVYLVQGTGKSRVEKSTTVSSGDAKKADKIAQALGIDAKDASNALHGLNTAVGKVDQGPKTLISMAQEIGSPEDFVKMGLKSPFWGSDAFGQPPTAGTRLAARDPGEGLKMTRLSRFGLVFREGSVVRGGKTEIDRFVKDTSKTTPVTEWQHLGPDGLRSPTPAVIEPVAAVEINDRGEIVRILDHNIQGASPAEARGKLIDFLTKQGWTVKLSE
jgi:hypothetical protein